MLNLQDIIKEIENVNDLNTLEEIRKKYLWKKWIITQEFKKLKDLPLEEKKEKGQFLSQLKQQVEEVLQKKQDDLYKMEVEKELENEIIDITLDNIKYDLWTYGFLLGFRRYVEEILKNMWFVIENWNEVVTKYQNFFSVNIPKDHPAVEMQDTFYLEQTDETGENLVLRTHTSSWQNEIMKKYWPCCKVMIPWKVFRYENTDASHDTTFWQLEWIVIDKKDNISLAYLIWFLEKFFSTIFWQAIKIRLRPAYFPFVEPWFEWDVSCPICWWKWCSMCKWTWWIEIFGAWMIHPNVLKEWNIDPTKYRWFAFGMWITRMVAIKYWIKDIRLFNQWDLRFLKSCR